MTGKLPHFPLCTCRLEAKTTNSSPHQSIGLTQLSNSPKYLGCSGSPRTRHFLMFLYSEATCTLRWSQTSNLCLLATSQTRDGPCPAEAGGGSQGTGR